VTPSAALATVIQPALFGLDTVFQGLKAECFLLAIGLQESGFRKRVQTGGGPAHGFWQFEPGKRGGIVRVLTGGDRRILQAVTRLGWELDERALYAGLATAKGDQMACLLARALAWLIPKPLPEVGDEDGSWTQYERQWGPGKPSRARWHSWYPQAVRAVQA